MCLALVIRYFDKNLKKPYRLYQLEKGPETKVCVTREEALKRYYQMQIIRRMELVASNLYKEQLIRGFCHLYSGQEAVCVGIKAAMRKDDPAITAYRCHGWAYIMGIEPVCVLAELTGRMKGCVRGKGGSIHLYGPNLYGGNGIVGAHVPVGTGIAFAAKYRDEDSVCITCYGDGAANQGQVHESYNMAYLYKLPVVYVCENNHYAMGTSAVRSSANPNYYTRGDIMPGIWVDGMDILAVKSATEFAIQLARCCVPIILEMATYRYYGHSMSDPGVSYRTRDEIDSVRKHRDPITSFREVILSNNLATAEEIKAIDSKVKNEIDKAAEIAKTDKEVPLEEVCSDVYFQSITPNVRGVLQENCKHKVIAKRPEQPIVVPKEKPQYAGSAFTIFQKTTQATVDMKGKQDEKDENKKRPNDEGNEKKNKERQKK